ncbi:ThiF family adenylyltransferase [Ectothiorhodospira marina]|uniref:Molybdopterin or thiamine biosynthesis adenylyltransferase n=1 Tax=Ectothiorhodospira marina TaxID=1396821 RepID=A0A1H7IR32_9GAMM|nr:ThiF family adenylyltransferase [Ectothiorhodospira marina]SEK63235.1 Molybdopterin or thiamine biosynthesis adenylyltransferase [Ectothiorhodospira marina]
MGDGGFNYQTAFQRTLGWITEAEQQRLRGARVAIAGLGGVGGSHLLTLARLGIGRFHLADFDVFELHNMNRQAGATLSSLGQPKLDVLQSMAWDINPELEIQGFPQGVHGDNLDIFLRDVDIYVDGLDFFAFEARRQVFRACRERGIPAVTAAPLGMGSALLTFLPQGMSFDDYFRFQDGQSTNELSLHFMMGLAPAMLQMGYLADPSRVDLAGQKGPSTPMACDLCAGMAGTEVLKLLLGRGRVRPAPHGIHFDAYRGRMSRTWRPGGNGNPIQRLLLSLARRRLSATQTR